MEDLKELYGMELRTTCLAPKMEDLKELSGIGNTGIIELPLLQLDDIEGLPPASTLEHPGNKELSDDEEDYQSRYIHHFQDHGSTGITSSNTAIPARHNSSAHLGHICRSEEHSGVSNSENVPDTTVPHVRSNGHQHLEGYKAARIENERDVSNSSNEDFHNGFHRQANSQGGSFNVWSRYETEVFPEAQADSNGHDFDPFYDGSEYAATSNSGHDPVINGLQGAARSPGEAASHIVGNSNPGEEDSIARRLENLHQHDVQRDRLINDLHQENLVLQRQVRDLRKALMNCGYGSKVPNGHNDNPRAGGATKRLADSQDGRSRAFVYVLIDCEDFNIHEDLLQNGTKGGAEFAHRLELEARNHLPNYEDGEHWDLVVGIYVDVNSLLVKYASANLPLSKECLMDFVCAFNLAQPLFDMVDVGGDRKETARKLAGLLHFFLHDTQCIHIFLGYCCEDGYALEPYVNNSAAVPRITLLRPSHIDGLNEHLPFETVDFPFVFGPGPYPEGTEIPIKAVREAQSREEAPVRSGNPSAYIVSQEAAVENNAIASWQAAAGGRADRQPATRVVTSSPSPPKRTPIQRPVRKLTWGLNEWAILLNVNNERVDSRLEEVDDEVSGSMLDRIEVRKFCNFYHILDSCVTATNGKTCRYVHGPELSPGELVVLRGFARKQPCEIGSKCRRYGCMYGHVCLDQPGCQKERCTLVRYHGVDRTAFKIWRPS